MTMNIQLRTGIASDATAIHNLITANLSVGHLLPRTFEDVESHAERFVVAVAGDTVIGCGELAPLSSEVAEVRSLVVDEASRGQRAGVALVTALADRARELGYVTLCAFTHQPSHFVRLGLLDRPARVGSREDRARLRRLQPVPSLRSIRRVAGAARRRRAAARTDGTAGARSLRAAHQRRAAAPSSDHGMSVAQQLALKAIEGGVSAPAGFRAAGVACGIKKAGGLDLALIVSDATAAAAAVFTTNKAQAAPVLVSKARLRASGGRARVVAINSGCANACTGPEGAATAEAMADAAAQAAGADAAHAFSRVHRSHRRVARPRACHCGHRFRGVRTGARTAAHRPPAPS